MTAKEYLNRVINIDRTIDKKIEYLERLRAKACKATSTITDMPGAPVRDVTAREVVLAKLIDLEDEITRDIDHLVDVKKDVSRLIDQMPNVKYRELLTSRYLLAYSWEKIAEDMNVSVRYIYKLHGNALLEFEKILRKK